MAELVRLGAINTNTKEYELPMNASKGITYECPDCHEKVIFRKGKIRRPHYAHIDANNKCNFYDHVGESQIHMHAKEMLKYVLMNKKLSIGHICSECGVKHTAKINVDDMNSVKLEYHFNFNDTRKIADVALVTDDVIEYIFEICYKHKTSEEHRPEPWVEFDACELINIVENSESNEITLNSIRDNKCKMCKKYERLDKLSIKDLIADPDDFEWYIRYVLGQRIFEKNPSPYDYCDSLLWRYYCHGEEHGTLDFNAQDYIYGGVEKDDYNCMLISKFSKFFGGKRVIITSHEGDAYYRIVTSEDEHNTKYIYGGNDDSGTIKTVKIILLNFK